MPLADARPIPRWGRDIKLQVLHLSGHNSGKGNGALCPILSAASQPPLVSGDRSAHTASWDTPWGK
jgi:hypothetical protein